MYTLPETHLHLNTKMSILDMKLVRPDWHVSLFNAIWVDKYGQKKETPKCRHIPESGPSTHSANQRVSPGMLVTHKMVVSLRFAKSTSWRCSSTISISIPHPPTFPSGDLYRYISEDGDVSCTMPRNLTRDRWGCASGGFFKFNTGIYGKII